MSLFRGEGDGSVVRREFITLEIPNNPPAAGGYWTFVADRNYNIMGVREIHSVAGGASYAVAIRKVTVDGTAPNAAASATVVELLSGTTIALTGAANTAQVTVPVVNIISKGDRIAFNFSGTNTGYVGAIQLEIEAV